MITDLLINVQYLMWQVNLIDPVQNRISKINFIHFKPNKMYLFKYNIHYKLITIYDINV